VTEPPPEVSLRKLAGYFNVDVGVLVLAAGGEQAGQDAGAKDGLAGSALVGVARVEAGSHFPSDVLIGFAVGTSIGMAVPALHTLNLQATPLFGPQTSGLAVTGAF